MFSRVKAVIKSLLSGLFYFCGLFHLVRFINNISGRRVTILAYHRVINADISSLDRSLPSLFVTKNSFVQQLEFLRRHYTLITFRKLKNHIAENTLPKNSLIITFDDGYEDNYRIAYPVMQHKNISSAMFLTVDKIGENGPMPFWWDRMYYYLSRYDQWYVHGRDSNLDKEIELLVSQFRRNASILFSSLNRKRTEKINRLLDDIQAKFAVSHDEVNGANRTLQWDQVQKMSTDVEFGSHTCSHCNLVNLTPAELQDEIETSLKKLRTRSKNTCGVLSYPAGCYNDAIKKITAQTGYDFAVTTESGINDLRDKYALKRICIWEGTSRGINGEFSRNLFAYALMGF